MTNKRQSTALQLWICDKSDRFVGRQIDCSGVIYLRRFHGDLCRLPLSVQSTLYSPISFFHLRWSIRLTRLRHRIRLINVHVDDRRGQRRGRCSAAVGRSSTAGRPSAELQTDTRLVISYDLEWLSRLPRRLSVVTGCDDLQAQRITGPTDRQVRPFMQSKRVAGSCVCDLDLWPLSDYWPILWCIRWCLDRTCLQSSHLAVTGGSSVGCFWAHCNVVMFTCPCCCPLLKLCHVTKLTKMAS